MWSMGMIQESGFDFDPNFYTDFQLKEFGFTSVGKNVKVSSKCSFYGIQGSIGNNVRIDDFCIFKGAIYIGSNVHVCSYSMVSGVRAPVVLSSFCVLAARCSIYTSSNNHSADALPAPLAPERFTSQITGPVIVGSGVMIGAHVVILPNVVIGDGASVGAGCVISQSVPEGIMVRNAKPTWSTKHKRDDVAIRRMITESLEDNNG